MSVQGAVSRLLPAKPFARSVTILAGGTAVGQIVLVLAAPILTRLYTPADFGILAVYGTLLLLIAVVASLRYELAIPLPEDDLEAAHVVALSLTIIACISLLTALAVVLFSQTIAESLNTPALAGYLWLLPISVLLAGSYQVFNYWAIRSKNFTAIARTKLTQAVSAVAIQIAGFSLGPLALILGQIAGGTAGIGSLGVLAVRKQWALFREISPNGILLAAARYKKFPIYSTGAGVFNTLAQQLPVPVFATVFSPTAAGLYFLAHRILTMPLDLLGFAIGNVFFSEAAEARRNHTLTPLVASVHEKLVQIAMPPAILLFMTAPELFPLLFGNEWQEAGEIAKWMVPWMYLRFISSPMSNIFPILQKLSHSLIFQAMFLVIQTTAILLGVWYGDFLAAIIFLSVGSTGYYVMLLVWIMNITGNGMSAIFRPFVQSVLWSILLTSPVVLLLLTPSSFSFFIGAIMLSMALIITRGLFLFRAG